MAAPAARDAAKTARTGTANGGGSTGQGKTVDEVKEQLYATFNEALEKTKAEVKQMQDKLKDYDEKYHATETMKQQGQKATDFLNATLEEIKVNLDSLTEKARGVFVEAKDLAAETVTDIWKSLNESIEKLRKLAIEFDNKYQLSQTMSELTAPVLERLKVFGGSFDQAMDTLKDAGMTGRKYLIGTAASLEHKYQIESKLTGLDEKFKISENVKNIQAKGEEFVEKQHIKERVKQLDERFTGSKARTYIEEGVKLVQTQLEEIQKDYATAKDQGTAKKAL